MLELRTSCTKARPWPVRRVHTSANAGTHFFVGTNGFFVAVFSMEKIIVTCWNNMQFQNTLRAQQGVADNSHRFKI